MASSESKTITEQRAGDATESVESPSSLQRKTSQGVALEDKDFLWYEQQKYHKFLLTCTSPICFESIKEAFMTKCGHSFW